MTDTQTDTGKLDEKEADGQLLQRLVMDGKLWAEEMHKRFPQIAEDDLLGWCCNMIMAGYDEAMRRAEYFTPACAEPFDYENPMDYTVLRDFYIEHNGVKP